MTVHLTFRRVKLHSRTEAALAAEIEASLAQPMEVATEATSEDAPAQVQVQVNSWQGRVFFKPPPGRDSSSLEDLARDSASFDETLKTATNPGTMNQTPSNHGKNQRGTAGQEQDDSDCDLELKDGEDSELPKVAKVASSLEDCADVGKDVKDSAVRTKQGHVDDHVGGGDEDGIMTGRSRARGMSSTMPTSMRDYSRSWSRLVRSGASLCRASWTRTKKQVKGRRG